MKKILLVCAAGMSTSMIVKRMQQAAKEQGIEVAIEALNNFEAMAKIEKAGIDVVLLSPQVRHLKADYEKKLAGTGIYLAIIDMQKYGMMDGAGVLKLALDHI